MRHYAVFGNPISHSKSPLLHNFVFRSLNIPSLYGRYALQGSGSLAETFRSLRLTGANVTVPFKEEAFDACDTIHGIAQKIGSVNTLRLEDGKINGYNTDAEGFYKTLEGKISPKRVLILGAGGTAKALATIFREKQIPCTLLNRSKHRLEPLIKAGHSALSHEEFSPSAFDLILNATSAGLSDDSLPLPKEQLQELFVHGSLAYDVIYGKETPFLRLAKAQNLSTQDGRAMLIEQAALSAFYFNDQNIPLETLRALMHQILPAS